MRITYNILSENLKIRDHSEDLNFMEGNIKMSHEETGCEGEGRIELDRDRVQWRLSENDDFLRETTLESETPLVGWLVSEFTFENITSSCLTLSSPTTSRRVHDFIPLKNEHFHSL
jgi:hypothetical protein